MREPDKVLKGRAASGYEGAGPVGRVALMQQGWDEFLKLPTLILAAFIALAALTLWMDNTDLEWLRIGREQVIGKFVFVKEESTASLLGELLGGLLTVISITFSVLLLAVQQTATSLSNQVYSQFLRRRLNQLYFGFFLGLAVYELIALAAVHPHFNPVYTASAAVVMSSLGLCLLVLLIYSTVDQMRPSVIIQSLRDHTLSARERSLELLRATRRTCQSRQPVQATVFADNDGFLQQVDLDRLARVLEQLGPDAEIELVRTIGSFIGYDDRLALIRAGDREAACAQAEAIRAALSLRRERDLRRDAAFGVVQLESIGWTTASSAKSTPEPPRLAANALRDLLGRWISNADGHDTWDQGGKRLAVVLPDPMYGYVLDAIVAIGIASDESMQHVVITAAFEALGHLLPRVRGDLRASLLDAIRTLIPAMTNLILTARLETVLGNVRQALEDEGAHDVAAELAKAISRKAAEKGSLRASGV